MERRVLAEAVAKRLAVLVLCALAVGAAAFGAAPTGDWSIVPGQCVGHVRIGEDAETLMKGLPPADTGDAAMGHSWATWFGRSGSELDVYTTLAEGSGGRKIVRIVRTTSPAFRTREGLRVGGTLGSILNAFPRLRRVAAYQPVPGGPVMRVYDDRQRGITFEVRRSDDRCTAIAVHSPGEDPTQVNMPMTAYVRTIHARR